MSTFSDAVAEKYNIMHQEANARTNLENTQASVLPGTAQAENRLKGAQTFDTLQHGSTLGPLAQSQIGEAGARSGLYGQQGELFRQQAIGEGQLNQPFQGFGIGNPGFSHGTADATVSDEHARAIYRAHPGHAYRKGTANAKGGPAKGHAQAMVANAEKAKGGGLAAILPSLMAAGAGGAPGGGMPAPGQGAGSAGPQMAGPQGAPPMAPGGALGMFGGGNVPGKGSGKVDKVPAMLAPHEAVLNKAAADMMGRGKIAALNAKGVQKMGMGGKGMPRKQA